MTDVTNARDAVLDVARRLAAADRDGDGPPTGSDDWSLDRRSLTFLACLVQRLQPCAVLEFGSGASTVVLATAMAALPVPSQSVAIESDPLHHARTTCLLEADGLEESVRLVPAHIVARRRRGRYVPIYEVDRQWDQGGDDVLRPGWADLILVDGPPLPLGGREGALYQALEAARTGAVIVLDDSRRDSERELLGRLMSQFGGSVEAMNLLGFDKGLAVVIVTTPIEPESR